MPEFHICRFILILNMICVFFNDKSNGQNSNIEFENFTDADGLSSNSIQSIVQDNKGFLWFGTEDGLNKYDGYTFKNYYGNEYDTLTLSHNRIEQIIKGQHHNLWLRNGDGTINLMDLSTEKVNRFSNVLPNNIPNKNFAYILLDHDNVLWLFTRDKTVYKVYLNGNKKILPQTKYIKYIIPPDLLSRTHRLWSAFKDSSGVIWINDMYWQYVKMIPVNNSQTDYRFEKLNTAFLNFNNDSVLYCGSVSQDSKKNYWITANGYIVEFDLNGRVKNKWKVNNGLRGNFVQQNNYMWCSTNNGLARINLLTKKIEYIIYEPGAKGSLAFLFVISIYCDKQGILWAGTHNGLSKWDSNKKKFALFRKNLKETKNNLPDNRIRAIAANDSGIVWLGTDQHGLSRYNTRTGEYMNYIHTGKSSNEILFNSFGSILCLGDSVWLAGSINRLQVFDDVSKKFYHYKFPFRPDESIKAIRYDGNNIIWLAGQFGLCRLKKNETSLTRISFKEFGLTIEQPIRCISNIVNRAIWLGGEDGILLHILYNQDGYPLKIKKILLPGNYNSGFSKNTVNSIYNSGDAIWIGTYGGGLLKYNPKQQVFVRYTTRNGLSNDVIYGIMPDQYGNLWMSTNKGISKFVVAENFFCNYTSSDGLQGNEFNSGAYSINSSGYMFFGGTNGWNMFHPDSIKTNIYEPEIVFTGFEVFNKPVAVSAKSLFTKEINYTNEITLQYEQSVFSFEFAALNYTNSMSNQYQYLMEGYDKEWQHLGTRRFITFTNLNPGHYSLKIKGSNNDGVWSRKIKTLRICILPAWYQTWWFKIAMVMTIAGLAAAIYYWVMRFRRIKRAEQRNIREQVKKDLHDDLKSDLAAIERKAMVVDKALLRGDQPRARERAREISELTQRALSTVDDLSWAFNPLEDSADEMLKRMKNFIVAIMTDEINYTIDFPDQPLDIMLPFKARKHTYLIFKECLQNMVKHAFCKNAWIRISFSENKLTLLIKDDGCGFDMSNLDRASGVIHIKERAREINGKLIIKTAPHEGTSIFLEVPAT